MRSSEEPRLVPVDDGACDHLNEFVLPKINLRSSTDGNAELVELLNDKCVLFVYPATGTPESDPGPDWDSIPGAPGCTVQNLGYAQLVDRFCDLGYHVAGLSSQAADEQREFYKRNHLPFHLFSDSALLFARRAQFPTFQAGQRVLYKRLSLVVVAGVVQKCFYPVFPPERCAVEALRCIIEGSR